MTGGGYPVLTVNGERVTTDGQAASDPAAAALPHPVPDHTNYDRTVLYDTFDVTGFLRSGTQNVLAAEVGRGFYGVTVPGEWYWNMGNFHGEPRMLARLVIDYADGTSQTVVTDHSTWKTIDGPTTFDSVYTGEKYDARIAAGLSGWDRAGYDDSAWKAASQFNPPARARSARAPASCPTPAPCRPGSWPPSCALRKTRRCTCSNSCTP